MDIIYIVGCNGFIGNRLFRYFKRLLKYRVIGIDQGKNEIFDDIILSDFTDVELLKNKIENNSFVIHTSAYIPEINNDNIETEIINEKIIRFVIEVFKEKNVKKFFNISTISLYGYGQRVLDNVTENDMIILANYYSKAKYRNEILLTEFFANNYNLRISSPFGEGKKKKSFLDLAIGKIINNEEIVIYGNGERTQDYIWVEDIARIIEEILIKDALPGNYNLTSGMSLSVMEVISIIENVTQKSAKTISINRAEDYSVSVCNNKLLKEIKRDKSFFTLFEKAIMELL